MPPSSGIHGGGQHTGGLFPPPGGVGAEYSTDAFKTTNTIILVMDFDLITTPQMYKKYSKNPNLDGYK